MATKTCSAVPLLALRGLAAAVLAVVAVAGPATAVESSGGQRLAGTGVIVDAAAPAPPQIAADSWLVADLDTGQVLAAKDPHGRFAPASTLKTLTALTLLPLIAPDRRLVPTFDDVNVDGSKVGVVERVAYPASELFSALLMVSGNDAANVLATAAGGQQVVAAAMNERARELGALDTHAVNPHGLDAVGQFSSAYDLALLGRAAFADPDFLRYARTRNASVSGPGGKRIDIANKNRMLRTYPGMIAGKNGYTIASRGSYVGAAERDGHRVVVTLMKSTPKVFEEATKLLDWGFAAQAKGVEPVGELLPAAAERAQLPVVPAQRTFGPATGLLSAADDTTGLPVTLAGMGLAAAAILSVRHRPRPPTSRRATGSAPVQRQAPAQPARTPVGIRRAG